MEKGRRRDLRIFAVSLDTVSICICEEPEQAESNASEAQWRTGCIGCNAAETKGSKRRGLQCSNFTPKVFTIRSGCMFLSRRCRNALTSTGNHWVGSPRTWWASTILNTWAIRPSTFFFFYFFFFFLFFFLFYFLCIFFVRFPCWQLGDWYVHHAF